MSETIDNGLELTIPTFGETNWQNTFRNDFATPISSHAHTGNGDGAQISADSFADDAITGAKFRLNNNQAMRARNNAGTLDLDLFKADTSDRLRALRDTYFDGLIVDATSNTSTGSGAISLTTGMTILNGTSLAMTLANGVEGQSKVIVNIASTAATVTPATTTSPNTFSLLQYGFLHYRFLSGEWRPLATQLAILTDPLVQAFTGTSHASIVVSAPFLTFSNGSTVTASFAAPTAAFQEVFIMNLGAGQVNLTFTGRPAASDVAAIVQHGSCRAVYANTMWYPQPGGGCTLA